MTPFSTKKPAQFRCVANFRDGHVLNLNFGPPQTEVIFFHLSVRRDEDLIVLNRRDAAGWRREIRFAHRFARRSVPVRLSFAAGTVAVQVDGRDLGRYSARPAIDRQGRFWLRRGFPGLDQITQIGIEGALEDGSVSIDTGPRVRVPPMGVHLGDRLDICWAGLTRSEAETFAADGCAYAQIAAVAAEADVTPTRCVAHAIPSGFDLANGEPEYLLSALLPGSLWVETDGPLRVDMLAASGVSLGQRIVAKSDITAVIERVAQAGLLATDDLTALQVLEHCAHGGGLAALSPDTARSVIEAARRFGLVDFVLSGPQPTAAAPIDTGPIAAERTGRHAVLAAAREAFTAHMRANPDHDPGPQLDTLLAQAQSPQERDDLIMGVVEWYCLNNDPFQLAAQVSRTSFESPGNKWALSVVLPILYCQGRFGAVTRGIERLRNPDKDWIVTPALGWVIQAMARQVPSNLGSVMPLDLRNRAAAGFVAFIDRQSRDYWGRSSCLSLVTAMVELIHNHRLFDPKTQDTLFSGVERHYALSPRFWTLLSAHPQAAGGLPPPIARLHTRFQALFDAIENPLSDRDAQQARLDACLDPFVHLETTAVDRFRLDLLGARPADPVIRSTHWHSAAEHEALRHVAHPLTHSPDPVQLSLAQRALRLVQHQVPTSPLAQQRARAVALSHDVLSDTGADVAPLIDALTPLADPAELWFGLGYALMVAATLADQGRHDAGIALALGVIERTVSSDTTRRDCLKTPAMRRGLSRLMGHPRLADAVCDALQLDQDQRALILGDVPTRDADPTDPAVTLPQADTVICLYTCRANLDTRVQAIRETWMRDAQALGVPVLIFVGDGDGQRRGDVVSLDAPDTYEGLPQKTLAMAEWVLRNTSYGALYKVDDDCYVDVRALFESMASVKYDYMGRRLGRVRGQMDRTWHMAKARSARGRMQLDKSPEPSVYADGGSGYFLSRHAMGQLVEASRSQAGRALCAVSFMEDKLVGDLLSMAGIELSSESYQASVLRRTHAQGPLVPKWENSFLPHQGGSIALAHLDGHERMAEVHERAKHPRPHPAKIWPSFQPVKLGARSNALDLISPVDVLERVAAAEVAVVACLRNERFMIGPFLDHYRSIGVTGFLIADNGSDDGTFEFLSQQPDVALFAVDTDYSVSQYGVAWQQALLSAFRTNRWTVVADADELLVWSADRRGDLRDLLRTSDFAGADAARVFMLDMYPAGPMAQADFSRGNPFDMASFVDREPFLRVSAARGPFSDGAVFTSAVRHRLIPGSRSELFVAQKYALLRYQPWMRLSAGLHFVAERRPAARDLLFAHFKYNAAFHSKAKAEVARKQHFNNAEEYAKYLALVSEGRDVIHDPAVSVPWTDSAFVQRIFAGKRAQE